MKYCKVNPLFIFFIYWRDVNTHIEAKSASDVNYCSTFQLVEMKELMRSNFLLRKKPTTNTAETNLKLDKAFHFTTR